jgi:hypothetical protein
LADPTFFTNKQYRMPTGVYVDSVKDYADAWHALGDKIESLFPGYKLSAYDPGLKLFRKEGGELNLSSSAACLLLETIEKNYTPKG